MKYQTHLDFSAQAITFRSLQKLFGQCDLENMDEYDWVVIVVFAAFSVEAYINSIGSRKIVFWDQIEKLSWKNKIEILHSNAGAKTEWGHGPLQFASEIFKVRDRLAHGKPVRVSSPILENSDEAWALVYTQQLIPDWLKKIDREWVLTANERTCSLMEYLGSLYKLPSDDFTQHSRSHMSKHD